MPTDMIGRSEILYHNRFRVVLTPRARIDIIRERLRLQCHKRGHAYGKAGVCQRCGDLSPESQALIDKVQSALADPGTGKKEGSDDATR